jgi:integrase
VNQLLDAYLETLDVGPTTRRRYDMDIRLRLRPVLGNIPIARVEADMIERYYSQLRVCRERCQGRGHTRHRTPREHECDDRCGGNECLPLSVSSIRSIHSVLSSAFKAATRWRWISVNPLDVVQVPAPTQPDPHPPSPAEAARILEEAWLDPEWGAFIWTAMITGARRGELCSIKREDLDLAVGVLTIRTSLKLVDREWVRLDTKTHQQRRIALDPDSVEILQAYMDRLDATAQKVGATLGRDAYLFTLSPDGSAPMNPDTVTQRFGRMVERLGINSTFHKLRHYSATELISAGVDIRTVAGRLGHGGGGTTTLRVYAAWVSEADQRAATALAGRLLRPGG